jgi:hypothetical protein
LAWGVMSPSSTTPTQIYFENLSQVETYTVYWVDFAGVEKKYYTLTPLESYTQNTYLWHIWVVRDSQRNIATTYTSLYNWDVVSVGIKSLPVETKRAEVSTMPILASGMGIYKIISKPTIFSYKNPDKYYGHTLCIRSYKRITEWNMAYQCIFTTGKEIL